MIERVKSRLAFLRGTRLWGALKTARSDWRSRAEFGRLREAGQRSTGLRILAINHYFDGELEAFSRELRGRTDISIVAVRPEPLFSRALAWFPPQLQRAGIPYDDPSLDAVRARYRTFCRRLFARVAAEYRFDCVITPSDCFYWLREFLAVCAENGVPTVVADKEGMISPRSFESEPARIRAFFPPVADWFFVWSERQCQFWRMAGVPAERIRTIGSARTDLFVGLRPGAADSVLVFDFDADAYVNNIDWEAIGWTGDRTWNRFRLGFYLAIREAAREFPAVKFLIKCHPQQIHTDFPVTGLLELPNLSVIRGAPQGLPQLVANARAVVGFQTTALVEAALAGAPVLYAAWGELYSAVADRILPWNEAGFGLEWIDSEERFLGRLRELLGSQRPPANPPDRSRLSTYFYNADGNVARRLLAAAADIAREREGQLAVR